MKFGNIHFIWLLWLIPAIIVFYVLAFKRKQLLIERFVSAELKERLLAGISPRRQKIKIFIIILAVIFSIVALIRPKYGFHWEEVKMKGVDIMIALDVSSSMLAEDVSPNRLERAKREIIDLLSLVQGDRIGLIAFAGTSFLQCPLTLDYGAVQIFLDDLDTELIPVPGTAIGEAIEKSISSFDQKTKKSRVLILITDGEDHKGDPVEAAKKASEQNIKIYAIGIGKEGGAPIPDPQHGGFKKDRRGELVLSTLDETTLQKVALTTQGSYVRSITGNLDLERIYQDIRKNVDDKDLKSGKRKRYEERYQWPLAISFLLLLLEMLLSERSKALRRGLFDPLKVLVRRINKKTTTLGMLMFVIFMESSPIKADILGSKASDGIDAFQNEDYQTALQSLLDAQIEDPNNLELKYNLANTYYKMGDYQNAEKLYQDVAVRGDHDLAEKAYYNLGNTAYKQGKLQEALSYYQKMLQSSPNDEDANFNLEFVRNEIKRRLEEQKKRQSSSKIRRINSSSKIRRINSSSKIRRINSSSKIRRINKLKKARLMKKMNRVLPDRLQSQKR